MDENETERQGRVIRTIPADTFAHRLLLVRAERGITLREAAEKCGLNYGSWHGWEQGSLPRDLLDVVDAIVEALSVDRDWLLDGGPLTRPERRRRVKAAYPRSPFSRPVPSGPGHSSVRRPRRVDRHRVPA